MSVIAVMVIIVIVVIVVAMCIAVLPLMLLLGAFVAFCWFLTLIINAFTGG